MTQHQNPLGGPQAPRIELTIEGSGALAEMRDLALDVLGPGRIDPDDAIALAEAVQRFDSLVLSWVIVEGDDA